MQNSLMNKWSFFDMEHRGQLSIFAVQEKNSNYISIRILIPSISSSTASFSFLEGRQ